MKWIEILRKDNYALLQSESDTQYAVVSGYDSTQPENNQWLHGNYFCYWNDKEQKVKCLHEALDYFRRKTEVGEYEYEYTPTQMAEKLLEFNRDFSDSAEDIQNEKEHVTELFEKLGIFVGGTLMAFCNAASRRDNIRYPDDKERE